MHMFLLFIPAFLLLEFIISSAGFSFTDLEKLWRGKRTMKPKCLCYVPIHGIYNGIELNKYRGEYFCEPNVFLCSKKAYLDVPTILIDCKQTPGCYYQKEKIKCTCTGSQRDAKAVFCGKERSSGPNSQCFPDLAYKCNSSSEYPYMIGYCEDIKNLGGASSLDKFRNILKTYLD